MAKRANPFIEDFVPQSKIHVGIKQFNNNEDRLQKVYEKTLELLFRGAKKPTAHVAPIVASADEYAPHKKDKMKQLCIGRNGMLSRQWTIPEQKCQLGVGECHCACGGMLIEARCEYCETGLCASCRFCCTTCRGNYCSSCTLTGCEATAVCVSCYN
ncbi:apoptosis regulatory protein Siva-like [Hyposmocoma kahamanoa]|uniref:apoptosis regulatory protein Siva-like n=1 Tax=Hyposmocoma kahamanoa TaxID=1477025 RepID=UPI000E6D93A1|nr:apoptosis regulatory protein Siva-like [Hyposmocoma kahamanoa]